MPDALDQNLKAPELHSNHLDVVRDGGRGIFGVVFVFTLISVFGLRRVGRGFIHRHLDGRRKTFVFPPDAVIDHARDDGGAGGHEIREFRDDLGDLTAIDLFADTI